MVEQDLPIALELLSTLSEAGLGFDAALTHILESAVEDRPLAREFRTYQADLLAGRSRVEALRRLASRLEVSSTTILVAALAQAEQLGAGIAEALHRQAADLRDRRRERASAFAMALPVKRMFPLVICFMPGIFVWTLGPFFVPALPIDGNDDAQVTWRSLNVNSARRRANWSSPDWKSRTDSGPACLGCNFAAPSRQTPVCW